MNKSVKRLKMLARIDNGVNIKDAQWLIDKFTAHYPDDAPIPRIYPTQDGNVSFEWGDDEHTIDLEIDLDTHWGDIFSLDESDFQEVSYNLDYKENWEYIAARIKNRIN